jgi:hypothetical protein
LLYPAGMQLTDLLSTITKLASALKPAATAAVVRVNGVALTAQQLAALGAIPAGDYWYDARCGLWGRVGGGALGVIAPNLPLAPMPPGVSGTGTHVFVNGREVTAGEVAYLARAVGASIVPGRYFLDAAGNAGVEGGSAVVNLHQRARQASYIAATGGNRGGGFYDPATGDHYFSFTDPSGKTYSSGV